MSNFHDVGTFHRRFGLPSVYASPLGSDAGPRPWDGELIEFRRKFLREELEEFETGVNECDHAKMADALIDLVYVAMGTAHLLGYPWEPLWDEVQAANMRKVRAAPDGSDSLRSSRWDVVKPEGWEGPDIEGVLAEHGFEPLSVKVSKR